MYNGRKLFFLKEDVNILGILGKEKCIRDCLFILKDRLNFPIRGSKHPVAKLLLSIY